MAKQLNVNLAFTADTGKAKQQIQELQSLLSQIAHTSATSSSTNKTVADLKQASEAAKELQFHLNNAFNTTTGKFDLSLLDRSLQSSKSNIASLSTSLLNAGSTGQQAFLKLAQSISLADQPMLRISNRMREFGTVMKNTIKWQLSSSMIHGFMGSLQSAYGYAQDLNKSLNDIRIVTGASVDEMARFAEQANKSAKALSTTTTDYTKASLIYYQQGLSAEEVQKRTDVTIKMANVAGTSAQTVSDQMTAVWNNFYDGTKSLEYYADVMTALGAKTASSVDEISGGLEKFAAIGDTIGLSYEYAAAALATITSNTRQSEEVVGTALKTIFARIQGLNLGETLDDGTTLNKYSQALEKVGISIFDQQGELKDMDNILDEMAAKWENLSKAQQTALAQTVAGTRQYTQLVALMDNWNKNDADSMKSNLATAYGAEGSLQEQADIYAESWEAAEKRVRASAEGIFQSLLDDKFFIKLNNGFANVLTGIDAFIDGLGGVKPLITGIASIFLANFAHKIPQALEDVRYNLQLLSPNGMQNAYSKIQTQMQEATTQAFQKGQIEKDSAMGYAIEQANELTAARNKLALVSDRMSESERQMANAQLSIIQTTQQEAIALKQKNEELQKSINLQLDSMSKNFEAYDYGETKGTQIAKDVDPNRLGLRQGTDLSIIGGELSSAINTQVVSALQQAKAEMRSFTEVTIEDFNLLANGGTNFQNAISDIGSRLSELKSQKNMKSIQDDLLSFTQILPDTVRNTEAVKKAINEIQNAKGPEKLREGFNHLQEALSHITLKGRDVQKVLQQLNGGNIKNLYANMDQFRASTTEAEKKVKILKNLLAEFQPTHVVRISEAFGALGGMMGNVVTIGRSISSIFSALSNPDLSGWEKFSTVLMSMSMIIPSVTSLLKGLGTIQGFLNAQIQMSITSLTAEQAAILMGVSTEQAATAIKNAKAAATLKEMAARKVNIATMDAETLATQLGIGADKVAELQSKLNAGATLEEAMAEMGLNTVTFSGIAMKVAATVAKKAQTSATWSHVAALIAENALLAGTLIILLAVTAAAGALALIIWGVSTAFKAMQASTPEGQLKAAKEEAKVLSEELNKAKSAAEELKSAFSDYDDAVTKLEECTEGTQEWREALQAVNNEVIDLMAKYPQLATMSKNGVAAISRNEETGALEIADWAKEDLIQQTNDAVLNTQMASIQANQKVREKQLIVDAQDIARELNGLEGTYAYREATQIEKENGQEGPVDVSSQVANYITQHPELFVGTEAERRTNLEAYQQSTGYDINIDAWLSAINQMGPTLNGAISAVEANTAATQAENEMIAEQILANNEAIQNSEHSNEIVAMAATKIDDQYEAEFAAMERWGKDGISKATGVNQTAKDIFKEYAEAAGIQNYDLLDTTGTDANRKFVYRDATTNEEVTVSLEAMRSVVAASRANEKVAENASGLLEILSDKTEEEAGLITGIITKDSKYLTVGQSDADNEIDDSEISDDFTLEDLADEIEDKTGLTLEDLKKLGYEGTDEEILTQFRDDYNQELENARSQTRQIIKDQVSIVNQELNNLKTEGLLDNLNLGELAKLGEILTNALISGGQEGVDTITSLYEEADQQGKGSEFIKLMSSIDWDTVTLDQLQDTVYELGLGSVLTTEEMQHLIHTMQDVSTSAGEAISQISKLAEILGNLKIGDTISAEAYKELEDMGLNVSEYFLKMADGSYQLISDATEFYNIVKQGMQEKAAGAIAEKQAENVAIGDENSGWIQWLNSNENGFTEYSSSGWRNDSIDKSGLFNDVKRDWLGNITGGQITEQGITQAQSQLDFLKLAGYDEAQVANWQTMLDNGSLDPQSFMDMTNAANEWIESMGGASGAAEYFNNKIQENNEEIDSSREMLASTADNISELQTMYTNGLITAEQLSKATKSIVLRDAAEEGFEADEIVDYAEALMKAHDATVETEEEAYRLALAHKRQQKGLDALTEGYEDWFKKMKSNGPDAVEALSEMQDAMADLLDFSEEDMQFLDADFFLENEELIKNAATKGGEYIDQLREKASDEIIAKVTMDMDADAAAEITSKLQDLRNQAQLTLDGDPVTIGTTIDNTAAFDGLQELLNQGAMTADEMNAYLASIGYDPVIEYDEMTVDEAIASGSAMTQHVQIVDPMTGEIKEMTLQAASDYGGGGNTVVRVPRIRGEKTTYRGSGGGTTSKPKPSGGGGGGGGNKTPKHAEKKNDSDKERYHTIQNQLEDLRAEYEEIADAKDRAFGSDKIKNIDKEIEKTQELINKQEEYIDAISADLPVDKAIMDEYYRQLIGGQIKYDENGNIANFDEIQDAMYAKYNSMADTYDEESEEWKVFEEKYEQLEKYIEQYEETYDLLRDEEAEYQELLNQRMDLELEKIQYAIELKLNIAEDSLALLDYQMSRIEDDAFKAAQAVGLFAEKAELLYDQMTADREGLNDILGQQLSSAEIKMFYEGDMSVLEGKTFTDAQVEAIKEYRDNLIELSEEFDEIRESIEEQVMEVFDAWNEKLEIGIESLEHYGSVLESYKNIIDIVGEDGLGISEEFINNLNEAQIGNAIDKVNATRDAYEAMMQAQQEAEEALEDAKARGDEASIKMWTENLAELTDEANSAQEEFLSAWEDALDMIAEQFEMTVERIIESFNESIYALGGLEGLSEEFARQQETADIIMDDYQKIYELSKLSRDVQKTLDDTKIISGKQKLKKLMAEINDLQAEGVEMSQYDLEYLQAEYELRLAEIELEEARNAKDTVRLSKDNEGNWSYVYTQNSDAVDEAQQKYEDALYSMQDISSNYIDEMSEKLIETSQEMADALAALRIEDFASIDDYYAEVERIQKQYQDEMALQEAELQKAVANNKILYDEDMRNYEIATGGKYRLAEEFATAFKDTLLGNLMDSESNTVNYTDLISEATTALTSNLLQAAETYYINLENAMNAADTTTEDFASDTAENIDKIVEASKTGAEAIDQMATEMTEAFGAIADSVSNWQETYGMAMEEIINSNMAVIESFNKMLETLSLGDKKITVSYDIIENQDTPAAAFDTGGYTGEWGRGGRVAVVHQKELILNENDTSNFLSAIELTRMMLETIDLNARQASLGLGGLIASTIKEDNTQMLEQQVHITAEFPGITDHYEVENALTNLVNRAAQYANRK